MTEPYIAYDPVFLRKPVSGLYGSATLEAVRQCQVELGSNPERREVWRIDGYFGPETRKRIYEHYGIDFNILKLPSDWVGFYFNQHGISTQYPAYGN